MLCACSLASSLLLRVHHIIVFEIFNNTLLQCMSLSGVEDEFGSDESWRQWFLNPELPWYDPDFRLHDDDSAYESDKENVILFRSQIPLPVQAFVFFSARALFSSAYQGSPPRVISDASLNIILLYVWGGLCACEHPDVTGHRPLVVMSSPSVRPSFLAIACTEEYGEYSGSWPDTEWISRPCGGTRHVQCSASDCSTLICCMPHGGAAHQSPHRFLPVAALRYCSVRFG